MNFSTDQIIPSTEMIRNYKACRDKTKKLSKTIIFKNNYPDMILFDVEEYKKIADFIEYIQDIEHLEIYNMVSKRLELDDGKRYSFEDVLNSAGITDEDLIDENVEKVIVSLKNTSNNKKNILKCSSVTCYYINGKVEDCMDLIDGTEYNNENDLIKAIAYRLSVKPTIVNII